MKSFEFLLCCCACAVVAIAAVALVWLVIIQVKRKHAKAAKQNQAPSVEPPAKRIPYWVCPNCGEKLLTDPMGYLAHGRSYLEFGYSVWTWRAKDGIVHLGPPEHHCPNCRREILVEEVRDDA